jgi:hypothetical protein
MSDNTAIAATSVADWRNDPKLSEKWKFRFAFFEKYGAPAAWVETPEQRAALKQMSFGARIKIRTNAYAFFFGIIYYAFFLKLWRQALILLGIGLVYTIIAVVFGLPDSADRGFGIGYGMLCAVRANVLYYLKRTKGDIGWKM